MVALFPIFATFYSLGDANCERAFAPYGPNNAKDCEAAYQFQVLVNKPDSIFPKNGLDDIRTHEK